MTRYTEKIVRAICAGPGRDDFIRFVESTRAKYEFGDAWVMFLGLDKVYERAVKERDRERRRAIGSRPAAKKGARRGR